MGFRTRGRSSFSAPPSGCWIARTRSPASTATDARNALNQAIRRALPRAVLDLEARDDVDVLILTGAVIVCDGGRFLN